MKWLGRVAIFTALVLGPFSPSFADQYPSRPIRLIAPYAPGGGVDIMARLVAQYLSQTIGQSVVVENRPGAGGVAGTEAVVNSAADGYTLILASSSPIVVAPYLMKKLSYDPLKDLAPITLIANIPAILLVKPSSKINTIQQLIAMAKAEPGKLTFSSSGIGGTAHLAAQMLKIMAGVNMLHVPYKGTGPAILAVMSGEVTMTFSDVISGMPYVKSGQLKAVAITTPERSPELPKLPSIADVLPGYSATVWYGVFAPAKTPKPIIDILNKALVKAVHSPGMTKTLNNEGVTPIGDTPAEFAQFVRADGARWSKIIRESGMKPE
ncbi:tripartite tricarboxylate transporter substrate binding protein [Paralcaligenes sp. KSB-10]|uniref:Bug family tripartite tricarboxylate transporter substrate binding protein n=1 Tax=Paralcaligenes sp. KSB-10 TaxID=2901142 RepID=UPI001E4836C0|nr:tripartite tricarboxylate transporter substrate binding protein [Paralcaligenes sp. KSB-10]UHL63861.1 tripartite tricarboxylate transporter substrate binding protein [Paralcaligenes sp. KSB-10]